MESDSVSSSRADELEWRSCRKCGRSLRKKESIERGIGPVCFRRVLEFNAALQAAAAPVPAPAPAA